MTNPILPGFHPDPSIVRVGPDYYLATSTFEWFPGVLIYHSTDLVNWKLVARPLDRVELIDLKGVADSCGVWAPCLSHDGERFHLVYSQVRSFDGVWKDTPNYLIRAERITGPWGERIFLGSYGFDGSLFHDADGSKWFLSMRVDHRGGKMFGGIYLRAYDPVRQALTGPLHHIYAGADLGCTEGPHLYQKDGWYYLLTAEGGTGYDHAVTLSRSRHITGPYEPSPVHPLLSSAQAPDHPLQKAGHADLVQTEDGDWYLSFLVGRPLTQRGRCILGRETAIERLIWPKEEWPRLESEQSLPRMQVPNLPAKRKRSPLERVTFSPTGHLPDSYQSLRVPIDRSCDLQARPGYLRLTGRESLSSTFDQSLLARRMQAFHLRYTVALEAYPQSPQQMAGLLCYYNTGHHYYLHLMGDDDGKARWLQLIRNDNFQYQELLPAPVLLPAQGSVQLRVDWQRAKLRFGYQVEGGDWHAIGQPQDASILSDDYVAAGSARYRPAFTGAMLGIACQDLTGMGWTADFEWMEYEERELF